MQKDEADLKLFYTNPFELLLRYQQVFELIARRYACNGYYPFSHCEEIVQHVNEKVFTRIERIVNQFDGRVMVRTYLSAICRNIIMEYVRGLKRRQVLLTEYLMNCDEQPLIPYPVNYVIVEECRRLDRVMIMLGAKRYKLWLMMKLLYRIRVHYDDFAAVNVRAAKSITGEILVRLNENVDMRDRDIYEIVFHFFLKFESHLSHPDTLRKWFNLKTSEIIALMNGTPSRAAYCEDTLQLLVEKYFDLVGSGEYVPMKENAIGKNGKVTGYKMLKAVRKK